MNTDNQAGVCTPNSHNLDVMHLGCCTTCGGNKIVPADRPSPHPSAEAVSEKSLSPEEIAMEYAKGIIGDYDPELQEEFDSITAYFLAGFSAAAHPPADAGGTISAPRCPDHGGTSHFVDCELCKPQSSADEGGSPSVEDFFNTHMRVDKDFILPSWAISLAERYASSLSHAGQRLVDKQLEEGVGIYHQPLFNLMANDHGLTLLNSEMDEIIRVVIKMIEPSSESLEEKAKEAIPELKHIINSVSEARKIWEEGFLAGASDTDGQFAEWVSLNEWVYLNDKKVWWDDEGEECSTYELRQKFLSR